MHTTDPFGFLRVHVWPSDLALFPNGPSRPPTLPILMFRLQVPRGQLRFDL